LAYGPESSQFFENVDFLYEAVFAQPAKKPFQYNAYRTNPIFATLCCWSAMEISEPKFQAATKNTLPIFVAATPVKRTLEGDKVDVNRYLSGLITYYIGLHVGTEH
jgi:hypothetical protein